MIPAFTNSSPSLQHVLLIAIDVAAKSLLLLAIALAVSAVLGRRQLLARSAMWNACILGLLVLPITSMSLPRLRIAILPATPVPQPVTIADSATFAPIPPEMFQPIPTQTIDVAAQETIPLPVPPVTGKPVNWVLFGMLLYTVAAALLALRLAVALIDVRHLRRSGRAVHDPQWRETLTSWTQRLGITDAVQLLHSPRVSVPVAFGWLRPAVVVPASVLEPPLSARRSCILLHELAHVRRRDYLWQLLLKVLQVVYWPNPLIWLAGRFIASNREEAADALCVYHASSPSEYHLTLLEVAQSLVRRPAAALGIAMARTPRIAQRLERIDRGLRVPHCLAGRPVRSALTVGAILIAGIVGACQLSARENAATAQAPVASTAQPPTSQPARMRYFVALVVGNDRMTFEGENATWDQVREKLAALPNLKQTVFTVAVDNPDVPIGRFREALQRAKRFVDEFSMEYVSDVGVHSLGSKGDRPQELPPDQPKRTRDFVLLVVGKDRMTFQGENATWDDVHKRLADLPDPRHTVFDIAVDNPDVTTGRFSEAQGRAFDAVKKYGLEYVSDTGVKPLGSKSNQPQQLPVPPARPAATPAPALSASGTARVQLESGAEVELLGIRALTESNTWWAQKWWGLDGQPLKDAPCDSDEPQYSADHPSEKLEPHVQALRQTKEYHFAIRMTGPQGAIESPEHPLVCTWHVDDAWFSGIGDLKRGGRKVPSERAGHAAIHGGRETTQIRVGIGNGRWQTRAASHGELTSTRTGDPVIFSSATEDAGATTVLVTDREKDRPTRVVAIDQNGTTHVAASNNRSGTGDTYMTEAKFPGLSLKQIKEFRFQTAEYDWGTFPNVPLRPGLRTARASTSDPPASRPAAEAGDKPQISVDEPLHDFGVFYSGETLTHKFKITNVGKADLHINKVIPGCGCTTAGTYANVLKPGEVSEIPLALNTSSLRGPFAKIVTIRSDDPTEPEVRVTLKGEARRYVDVVPSNVFFGPLSGDQPQTKIVKITNKTDSALKITLQAPSPVSTSLPFKFDLTETQAGKEYELKVEAVPPWGEPGTKQVTLHLDTNLPQEKRIDLSITSLVPSPPEFRTADATSQPAGGAEHSGVVGFAIVVPRMEPSVQRELSEDVQKRYKAELAAHGPQSAQQLGTNYTWFELKCDETLHTGIQGEHAGRKYLLVYAQPPNAMFISPNERTWGITGARISKDRLGRSAITYEMDDNGGRLLSTLTRNNMERPLALIVANRILSIAVIRSEISKSAQLTGRFAEAELQQILSQLPVTSIRPAKPDSAASQPADAHQLMMDGWRLSAEEAGKLEDHVKSEPGDLAARTRLLGYYSRQDARNDPMAEAKRRHVLWIIQHRPESPIAGLGEAVLDPNQDGEGYRLASAAWLKQVDVHSKDAAVLGNAAAFFHLHEFKTAERLLTQASQLEPTEPKWPGQLARLYQLHMNQASGKPRQEWARKALAQGERAYELTPASQPRSYLLNDLAKTAFEAGELDKAERYARQDLADTQDRADWNYGNAIHHGNLVLGRIALSKGDVEQAKKYLALAGKTPGSPQLNSFGPNMLLASELLKRGEKQAVLDYFRAVASFWTMGKDKLEQWTKTVKDGGTPNFGGNVAY